MGVWRARSMAVAGALALLACAGVAIASGSRQFVVIYEKLKIKGGAEISPKALPRNRLTPITVRGGAKIESLAAKPPPALKEVVVETDKNGIVAAQGLASCSAGRLQGLDSLHARQACRAAVVGEGTTAVEVEFPGERPFVSKSKLLIFNGGVKGGVTTILVHAYLDSPVSAAVVVPVTVEKINKGRYGLRSVAAVPKIAGGYGSPLGFSLKIARDFTYKGKRRAYLLAQCPDGYFVVRGRLGFADGNLLEGNLALPCTPKG